MRGQSEEAGGAPPNRYPLFPANGLSKSVWLAAAIFLCLSVLLLNGSPLYYFDSGGYFAKGQKILAAIFPPEQSTGAGGIISGGGGTEEAENIDGSHSPVFAILVAGTWSVGTPIAFVLANLAALFASAWIVARVLARDVSAMQGTFGLTVLPITVAAIVSSLPFYVAYVMPDLFAAFAILIMALLVACSRNMRPWEIAFAFAVLCLATVVHRSHLLLVGLAFPVAVLGILFVNGRRFWLPALMMLAATLVGIVELNAYKKVADDKFGRAVVHMPFITARLIEDGPGLTFLRKNCPDPGIATCALLKEFDKSDNPLRLTASYIIFQTEPGKGSYRLLSENMQRQISDEQKDFALRVFANRPFHVIWAVFLNTFRQLTKHSIEMTVPVGGVMTFVNGTAGLENVTPGRLAEDRSWIRIVDPIHTAVYLISMVAIIGILLFSGSVSTNMRWFAIAALIGLLLNAFICGAVSQPAHRYGARVAWILPYLAVILAMSADQARRMASSGSSTSKT